MKFLPRYLKPLLCLSTIFMVGAPITYGVTIVFNNVVYSAVHEDGTTVVGLGNYVGVGSFNANFDFNAHGLDHAALTAPGSGTNQGNWNEFGSTTTSAIGTADMGFGFEGSAVPTGIAGSVLRLWITNSPTPQNATQWGIFGASSANPYNLEAEWTALGDSPGLTNTLNVELADLALVGSLVDLGLGGVNRPNLAVVPEPSTYALLGFGGALLFGFLRRRDC